MKNKDYKYWLLALLLFALIGCMTDRTAIMKVLTNPTSFDSVGRVYEHLHPCSSDTIIKGSDTAFKQDTVTNTFYFCDTLNHIQHDSTTRTIKVVATIHDTVEIRDNQILDDNVNLRSANSTLQALNSSNSLVLKECTTAKDKWQFWAILLGVGALLLLVALIFKIIVP